ncbi:FAD-binding oxidoreductase [Mesoterricola silvestris]|uniref:FAD-binding protein n=1 Tax=Mesoterricola silvestris TaxID=2927979 RepID=A0AA48GZ34_9BACT|nr:FAD-linked oxidase C-terminal domain-containing protein [Mesoterricola silvestris]BDU74506.1 FAD-binding protein [Mesoterricola silvestris]
MSVTTLSDELRLIVGRDHVLDGEVDRFGYSYDSSFLPLVPAPRPDVVVRPRTAEEVSRVMALAFAGGIPVTPRGAASGRTGGSVPLHGGISLALDRMTDILEVDEGNMMVTAEPGVRTMDLHDACAARGLFYPPDPASWKFSTIGGNVAENAGGMRAVKYGVTRDYVMGLQVVLADGTLLETGGKAIKNVTGYDLTGLFTGSEGTLGVITRVLLRLIPLPKARGVLRLLFADMDAGCALVHRMLKAGIVPSAAEIMDDVSLQAVARHRRMALPAGAGCCVIIEVDGEDAAELEAQCGRIRGVAEACGCLEFKVAQDKAESDELWAVRRGLSQAVAALAPNRLGEDISVPRDAFPEVVRRIGAIAKRFDLLIPVFGHAGDGNLHPSVLCDMADPAQAERVHRAVDAIFEAALAVGGTLSGEHGIGITKRPYLAQALGEAGVRTLQAVKAGLDPKGILNPGKIW